MTPLAILRLPHLVQTGLGAFYDGLAHVFVTPRDLLAVAAVALLAGRSGKPAARGALVALPAGWLAGALAASALALSAGPRLATATAISAALLGLAAAAAPPMSAPLVGALAFAVGLLHGGAGSGSSAATGPGLVGALLSVFVLVMQVAALAASQNERWQRIAVRSAGGVLAAIGVVLLVGAMRTTVG